MYIELLEQVSDGVYFVSTETADHLLEHRRGPAHRLHPEAVLGRGCSCGLPRHVDDTGCQVCQGGCPLAAVLADGMPRSAEVYLLRKDGHRVAVTVREYPLTDPNGRIVGSAEVFSVPPNSSYGDLRRRNVNSSDHPVTGLLARSLGEFHLAALVAAVAAGQTTLGVIFVDMDHF